MDNFTENKVEMNIVVTGASKGIGREVAKELDQSGHKVLAIARSQIALETLEKETECLETLAIDLSEPKEEGQIKSVLNQWGRVDVLINNAGQLINKAFLKTTITDFQNMFQSNVLTAVKSIQICSPYMKPGGHIVNISSMGGIQGSSKFNGLSAYSSSKGALSILTECLALELAEFNIKVNALALGAVQTEMLNQAFPDYKAPLSAQEMAKYICQFATEEHKYFNGQVLSVALGNP